MIMDHENGIICLSNKTLREAFENISLLVNESNKTRFKRQDKIRNSWKDYWNSFVE